MNVHDATLSNTMAETRNLHVATGGAIMRAVDKVAWHEIQHNVWLKVSFETDSVIEPITRETKNAIWDALIEEIR